MEITCTSLMFVCVCGQ